MEAPVRTFGDSRPVDLAPAEAVIAELAAKRGGGGGREASAGREAAAGRIPREALIPLLQALQAAYGYLPGPVLAHVSARTGIPLSRMYGVATFYAQFYMQPHGKHTVRCCRGTACHVRGGKKVIDAVRGTLGIADGGTTADMLFSLETVACLGACALSPVMVVNNTYYGKMTPRRAEQILRQMQKEEQG